MHLVALIADPFNLSRMKTIILFIALLRIPGSKGDDLYISLEGNDTNPCSEDKPCRSISFVCASAPPGSSIHIQGGESHVYNIDEIRLDKSLKLKSWIRTPTLNCNSEREICNFAVGPKEASKFNVFQIEEIWAEGCIFCLNSSNFEANKSTLSGGGVYTQLLDKENTFELDTCQLEDVELAFESNDKGTNRQLMIKMCDSVLSGPHASLNFDVTPSNFLHVNFTNVTFCGMEEPITFTNFSKVHFEGRNINAYNFTSSSHCLGIVFNGPGSTGNVSISESYFHDNMCNHGALHIEGGDEVSIVNIGNCVFSRNVALLAGSGLKVISAPHAEIFNSKFNDNYNFESAAGLIIGDSFANITNCDFRNNTVFTGHSLVMGQIDSWERKGAGGAVYVSSASKVFMDKCNFVNNTADWFGGSVASYGSITIQNSYFEHRETYRVNALGSMMYITGPTKVENIVCNSTSVYTSQAMIWYTSNSKFSNLSGVDTGYMELYCPPGSQFINSTLRASLDTEAPFKDFLYACRSCENGLYSLEQGYRIGSIYNETPIWSSGFQCLECPYGGKCESGRPIAGENYWGFQVQKGDHKEISFLSCPAGYCCTGVECQNYDSCKAGRYGDLCGRCWEGSSELVFATECYPNEKCNAYWYPAIDVANAIVFILMFLYQMEIGTFVATKILGQSPKGQNSGSPTAVNAYIKSFFYFYQTVTLLAVSDNRASQVIGLSLQPIIAGILSFAPVAALIATCPFPNLTPVSKILLRTTPTVFIYLGLGICAIGLVLHDKWKSKKLQGVQDQEYITDVIEAQNFSNRCFNRADSFECSSNSGSNVATTHLNHNFRARLSRACTNIFLLNYLTISGMTLGMLVCKDIGNRSVLFVDGTIQCIAGWQAVFIIVAILHTVPFFMAVIVSRALLDEHRITVTQFFLSYVMPLPMLIYWAVVFGGEYWRTRKLHPRQGDSFASVATTSTPDEPDVVFVNTQKDNSIKQEILFIVEDPYLKTGICRSKSCLYWEGILIFRRLVLLMMFIFTTNPLLQMTLQTSTCLIFLVWHMMAKPFRSKAANNVEAVSLTVLTIVGILHTIQATFMAAGRRPSGPNDLQITITDWIEWTLVSLPPLVVVALIILLVLFRLLKLLFKGLRCLLIKTLGLCDQVLPCRNREEYHNME